MSERASLVLAALVVLAFAGALFLLLTWVIPADKPDHHSENCFNRGGVVADYAHGKGEHDYFCVKGNNVIDKW